MAKTRTQICRDWRNRNPDKVREQRRRRRIKTPTQEDVDRARVRAKKKGLPCTITAAYIKAITPEICPVLGIPLLRNKATGPRYNSPSIDRIIPELGYVEGNVIVVSHLANAIRSNATPEQILAVGNFYQKLLRAR